MFATAARADSLTPTISRRSLMRPTLLARPPSSSRLFAAMAAVASTSARSPSPGHLIVTDFDGTCTQTDTTALVPRLAARAAPTPAAAQKVLSRFGELEELYLSGLSRCKTDELPAAASLEDALASMDAISNGVIAQLSASGILAGIRGTAVGPAISEWRSQSSTEAGVPQLRDGCVATLEAAAACGWELGVLSICWCPAIIRAYLPLLEGNSEGESGSPLVASRIWSNRIDEHSGEIANEIDGAVAKRAIIQRLVQEESETAGEGGRRRVVYLGDSTTDLLAMLAADVGILIGESGSARELARRFGVSIKPLAPLGDGAFEGDALTCDEHDGSTIWEAASWDEVRRCLLGPGK